MSQKYNSEYVNENEAFFIGRNDIINRYGNVISHYLMLPGLIGFWPMATVQRSTGNVPNYAPTYTGATKQDMVYNGNPKFNYTATGVPYIDLDGTGDYLSIADNTDLDVQGNEAQNTNPGLTLGGWFLVDTLTTLRGLMTKDDGGANRSFSLYADNTNNRLVGLAIGGAGTDLALINGVYNTLGIWAFCVLRWIPSGTIKVWYNSQTGSNVAANATINNTAAALVIGGFSGGALLLPGNATLCFLCANALSDSIIQSLFQQTRSLFGI